MNSTFAGLTTAVRGMASSQIGLSVTTNNISNVNTTGYSRQAITQTSIGPAATYSSAAQSGSGSTVTSVERVRNELLDQKYWQENANLNNWTTTSSYLSMIEENLGDTANEDDTSTGFTTIMDTFYTSLQDLSTDPSSASARKVVLTDAQAVCSYFNDTATNLKETQSAINTDVKNTVDQINSYAKQIADLNGQISIASGSGASTNDLEDQRTTLLDKLSALTDLDITETVTDTSATGKDVKTMTISVNGATLVSGDKCNSLKCTTDADGLYNISWCDSSGSDITAPFNSGCGGTLGSLLDLRDGDGSSATSGYQGIPYYLNQLNKLAKSYAASFNTAHEAGYGLDETTSGIQFFVSNDTTNSSTSKSTITAANISVNTKIAADTNLIACASASGGATGDSGNLSALIAASDNISFGNYDISVEDAMSVTVATLGTQSAYATKKTTTLDTFVANINTRRSSVSSVSTDDETGYMTMYNEAYTASSYAVSTWDEVLQTTINMVNT